MAPRKRPTPVVRALRKELGLVKNAKGKWSNTAKAYANYWTTMMTDPNNPNYRPPGGYGKTPFSVPGRPNMRMGFWNDTTNSFSLVGGGKGKGGKGGGKKGGGKKKGGGAAEESPLFAPAGAPYAEADIATTANIRAQGKAYALGAAGGLSARGQTGTPKKGKEEETATKKKGKRAKGMKRGKGGGRPKPGFHINKKGRIVKNSGKRKGK